MSEANAAKPRMIEITRLSDEYACGFWARAGTQNGRGRSMAEAVGELVMNDPDRWGIEVRHMETPFDVGEAQDD